MSQSASLNVRSVRTIGMIGLFISVALAPPVFSLVAAMAPLRSEDTEILWLAFGLSTIFAISMTVFSSRISTGFAAIYLGLQIVLALELGVRTYYIVFNPEAKAGIAKLAKWTYGNAAAYTGHPFLQFTGKPGRKVTDDKLLTYSQSFNNFGFHGADFTYEKPENTIRVITLGGSTTASGYPALLETYLNDNRKGIDREFEVLNFGMSYYKSAHLVVNFVLNVVDFSPDYVIIHQGWNDSAVRNAASGFRGDYAHALSLSRYPVELTNTRFGSA